MASGHGSTTSKKPLEQKEFVTAPTNTPKAPPAMAPTIAPVLVARPRVHNLLTESILTRRSPSSLESSSAPASTRKNTPSSCLRSLSMRALFRR